MTENMQATATEQVDQTVQRPQPSVSLLISWGFPELRKSPEEHSWRKREASLDRDPEISKVPLSLLSLHFIWNVTWPQTSTCTRNPGGS